MVSSHRRFLDLSNSNLLFKSLLLERRAGVLHQLLHLFVDFVVVTVAVPVPSISDILNNYFFVVFRLLIGEVVEAQFRVVALDKGLRMGPLDVSVDCLGVYLHIVVKIVVAAAGIFNTIVHLVELALLESLTALLNIFIHHLPVDGRRLIRRLLLRLLLVVLELAQINGVVVVIG